MHFFIRELSRNLPHVVSCLRSISGDGQSNAERLLLSVRPTTRSPDLSPCLRASLVECLLLGLLETRGAFEFGAQLRGSQVLADMRKPLLELQNGVLDV